MRQRHVLRFAILQITLTLLLPLHAVQKEEALAEFFPGELSLRATPLTGGMETPVWKIETPKGTSVLRLLSPMRPLHDVLREIWATELAAHQDIGPKVLGISVKNRAMLLEYVEGTDLKKVEHDKVPLALTARSIARLQESIPLEPFSMIASCFHDIEAKHKNIPKELRQAMQRVEEIKREIDSFGVPPVLCHGDFHLGQVLLVAYSNTIKVIDWTTATFGDRFYDLAKFSLPFSDSQTKFLLHAYFGRVATPAEKKHFFLTRKLVLMTIVLNRLSRSESLEEGKEKLHYLDPQAFSGKDHLRMSAWSALREFLGP